VRSALGDTRGRRQVQVILGLPGAPACGNKPESAPGRNPRAGAS